MALPTIKEGVLRELAPVSTLRATIAGRERGFAVVIRFGEDERILATSRGGVRLFASLDTAGAFFHGVGIDHFDVDMSGYRPGLLRKARPDRADALRGTKTKLRQQSLEFLK